MGYTTDFIPQTSITFLACTPIYGYSGQGYERTHVLRKSFPTLAEALKYKRRMDKVVAMPSHRVLSPAEDQLYREMTDQVSYEIKDTTKLYIQTTATEPVVVVEDTA